jgi:hypothetical protein
MARLKRGLAVPIMIPRVCGLILKPLKHGTVPQKYQTVRYPGDWVCTLPSYRE